MPYGCEVLRREGTSIVLRVVPEQPDAEPFHVREDFAVGLLAGEDGDLKTKLGADALDALASGEVDPSPYVVSLDVQIEERGSVREDRAPVALYTIQVTDERWIAHLAWGARFESYAWSEHGPVLPKDQVFEPITYLEVEQFATDDRVALRMHQQICPGELSGRGTVEATSTVKKRPRAWAGGAVVHLIRLDQGLRTWAFAESLRRPPDDTYERAIGEPVAFFDGLLARPPLERARALRFLALRGGGDTVTTAGGQPIAIAGRAPWMLGLLRRLAVERAIAVATELLAGWVSDRAACATRFGASVPGHELADGDVIEAYQYELCCPIELVVGALTLLLGAHRTTIAPGDAPRLRDALRALPDLGFGYPRTAWTKRIAYPLGACDGVVPALDAAWMLTGPAHAFERARALGLPGALVSPGEIDRIRP